MAHIAARNLTPKARAAVTNLLGGNPVYLPSRDCPQDNCVIAHTMLARMQLAKAGLRLAATLNAIFL